MTLSIRSAALGVERSDILSAAIPLQLDIINTLSQVRKTMNGNGDLSDLVESILSKGQKVAGLILAHSSQVKPVSTSKKSIGCGVPTTRYESCGKLSSLTEAGFTTSSWSMNTVGCEPAS